MPNDKPRVSLNLDTIEREGERREPFVIAVGGKPLTLADPSDLDWRELTAAQLQADRQDFRPLLQLALGDDVAALDGLPAWKIGRLLTSWQQHNGVTAGPEANASAGS